jgi:branched-chain amino acid transport system permease protein
MSIFVAYLASAISYGGILSIVAIGFLVLYRATGVVNFAHGNLIAVGAYVALWANVSLALPIIAAYAVGVAGAFVVGVLIERVAYKPLRSRPALPPESVLISTLGVGLIIEAIINIWQGSAPENLNSPLGLNTFHLFGASISQQRLLIFIISVVVVIATLLVLRYTSWGRQLRAIAADPDTARLCGIRSGALSTMVFGVSGALAGLAGVLIAPLISVSLTFGFDLMLAAFIAAIAAGFGSIGGTILAALLVGFIQQVIGAYWLQSWASTLPYVALLLILFVRPQGLFTSLSRSRL